MRNSFSFPILVLLLILSSSVLILLPEEPKCPCHKPAITVKKPPPKLSFSDFMTKKMAPTVRLEKLGMFPEEGPPVALPTLAYLNRLAEVIKQNFAGNNRNIMIRRVECERLLEEVRKGYRDIYPRIDPIYGRPVFNEDQLRYIRWGAKRIKDLLEGLEYECIPLTFEERQSVEF